MRVQDPFDDLDVGQRKAVLISLCTFLLVVAFALALPRVAGLLLMLLAFFVMIMLHEFGHFLVAKRSGMKVTEFFIGFGPRLWSVKKGETEYGVKAVPLGGYCKIIGMTNLEEVAVEDEPRAFRNKGWFKKVVVAAAGPAVHFVIAAILMFTVLFFAGDLRHATPTTKLHDVAAGAAAAGLRKGDQILSINDKPVTSWDDVHNFIDPPNAPAKPGDIVRIVARRGSEDVTANVKLSESTDLPKRAVAGISTEFHVVHPGLVSSIAKTPGEVVSVAHQAVDAVGKMFSPSGISNYFRILSGDTGKNTDQSQRFLSPVGYAQVSYHAVVDGWVSAVGLLLAINIFVGLFNLLPLLPFDGGHIAIATYEKIASAIRGRRVQVDAAKLMPITLGVLAVFGFIFLSSLFLDIAHPIANPY